MNHWKTLLAVGLVAFVLLLAGCAGNDVAGAKENGSISTTNQTGSVSVSSVSYPSGSFSVNALLCQPAQIDSNSVAVVLTGGDGVTLAALRPVCEAFAGQGLVALAHEPVNGTAGDNIGAVADGLAYLQERFPNMPRALWAHSSGTIFSVFAAYEQPNITAFVDTSGHMQIPLCDRPGSSPPAGDTCAAYLTDFPAPILVVHGENDPVVNVSYAYAFASRLQNLGKPYALLIVPDGVHEFMTNRSWVLNDEVAFIRHQSMPTQN